MPELVLESAAFAVAGLIAAMALTGRRLARWPLYPAAALAAVGFSVWASSRLVAIQHPLQDALWLALAALAGGVLLRGRHWPARLFLTGVVTTSAVYLGVVVAVTFNGSLPWLGLGLSVLLSALELLSLVLTAAFAFEIVEALGRDPERPQATSLRPLGEPRVCVQVPAYNEPPELVIATLEALARLDYDNYTVQVVVNNTTAPDLWRPVEEACHRLGDRFSFVYLPKCDGFKAGALNRATERLSDDIELVAIVDADYVVRPEFLSTCVPSFADQRVAFVQTPQHYRAWEDSGYLRGLFYAYRYFFDVTMVARSRTNAIIFGGTMGLIRLPVLRAIGGWAEWCITEDAEASLRILAEGWKGVYLRQNLGQGLMPLDFEGLRRQRFRWAFGGVQILRHHLALLMGLKPSRLTLAQRYHYLVGGLGWFGDVVAVGLGLFLLLTGPLLALGHPLLLRQLLGVALVLPVFLVVTGMFRLGWALKVSTGAPWRDVPAAVMIMLALSSTVAQACVRGVLAQGGVFLRTPKTRTPSRWRRALRSTAFESGLALVFLLLAAGLLLRSSAPLVVLVATLAAWQAVSWGSAPAAALLSQEVELTPLRALLRLSPQSTGERPWTQRAGRLALAPVLAVVLAILLAPAIATGSGADPALSPDLQLPPPAGMPGIPAEATTLGRSTSGSPGAATGGAPAPRPSATGTPSPSASAPSSAASPSPPPTASPSPSLLPAVAPSSLPTPYGSPTAPASRPTSLPTPR